MEAVNRAATELYNTEPVSAIHFSTHEKLEK